MIVPVLGTTEDEVEAQVRGLAGAEVDVVEWRVDHLADLADTRAVVGTARALARALGPVPMLVTCRTSAEGGAAHLDDDAYGELLAALAASGAAGLLDVELARGAVAAGTIETAHRHGVPVVASSHDFSATPPAAEIVSRLRAMQELGADVAKIAVMPRGTADVLTLLEATRIMTEEHARVPVVTMSMGALGAVSRLAGHLFGSAATFASAGTASAPGQLGVEDVRTVLGILDRAGAAGTTEAAGG